jgi:hypothetical protein
VNRRCGWMMTFRRRARTKQLVRDMYVSRANIKARLKGGMEGGEDILGSWKAIAEFLHNFGYTNSC